MGNECDLIVVNDEVVKNYEKVRGELETSLQLYRLVILHDIDSEIPKMYRRVKKCQAIYEELYRLRFPGGF